MSVTIRLPYMSIDSTIADLSVRLDGNEIVVESVQYATTASPDSNTALPLPHTAPVCDTRALSDSDLAMLLDADRDSVTDAQVEIYRDRMRVLAEAWFWDQLIAILRDAPPVNDEAATELARLLVDRAFRALDIDEGSTT